MKVNHKTFRGGYNFRNFEGSKVSDGVTEHKTTDFTTIDFPGNKSAYDVLKAFGATRFTGPAYAVLPTEGDIEPSQVKTVIINVVEAEPYNLSNQVLLSHAGIDRFVDGLKLVHQSFGNAVFNIVLTEIEKELIESLTENTRNLNYVTINTVEAKYPVNMTPLLVQTVLDTKFPVGYSATQIGVVCLDVSMVLAVEAVVAQGQALSHRIIALLGPGFKENKLISVPIGANLEAVSKPYLKDSSEVRLIKNSVMTGPVISEDDTVELTTSAVIALPEDRTRKPLFFFRPGAKADSYTNSFISAFLPNGEKTAETNIHGEHRACVNCTYCQTVCPMGLFPQILFKHVDKEIYTERLAELKIHDCIGCNLCNYVCPSKIDVAGNIHKGKSALEEREIYHAKYLLAECDLIHPIKEEVSANE